MIVRDSQIAAFEPSLEATYATSAVNYLESFDPVLSASAGREGLEQTARNGLAAARKHDLASGPALQLYLELMVSLGSGFDEDPQYGWLKPFLDPREDIGSVERARLLHFHTDAYIRRAYGANKEFARSAAERAYEQLERFTSPLTSSEIPPSEMLRWLHPQRLDFLDFHALTQLGDGAREAAAAAALPAPQGTNVFLILMFLFGYRVASDPLYPWVNASLKSPGLGTDRFNGLVSEARKHLAAILSGMRTEEAR